MYSNQDVLSDEDGTMPNSDMPILFASRKQGEDDNDEVVIANDIRMLMSESDDSENSLNRRTEQKRLSI